MTTFADIRNLQIWSSEVLCICVVLWAVSYAVSSWLDRLEVVRRARRIRTITEEQAERRRFQAVMPARRIQ